jgi:ribosome-associated heat shock protein Hsp15
MIQILIPALKSCEYRFSSWFDDCELTNFETRSLAMNPAEAPRLDKYLWAIRLYKTRTLATDAIRGGHVTINSQHPKPSHEVKVGEVYKIRQELITRTVKVVSLLDRRVGAKLVPTYAEDLTPASEYLKQMQAREEAPLKRDPGAGRPTKRDRRVIEKLLGE